MSGPARACCVLGADLSSSLWHNGAMTYLAQDKPVNVNAGPLRTVAGILAPSLFNSRVHAAIIALLVALLAFLPGIARPKTA